MLTIRLFGSPEISLAGRPVALTRRKSRALVYYLAAQTAPLRREQLINLLWVDLPRPSALQTLRTTLHGLKKALGDEAAGVLVLDGDKVRLGEGVWVDVIEFSLRLSTAKSDPSALAAALSYYRGDFLEGFSLPGAQAYEDWLVIERERLRRLAVRGWTALSGLHETAGDYPSALESLERALAFNPLQEDLQREAIRLLFLSGNRPGAIHRYDELRKLLDEEMGVPPMAETRSLYDTILSDHPSDALLHPSAARPRPPERLPGRPARPPAGLPPGERSSGATGPASPGKARPPAASGEVFDLFQLEGIDLPFVGRAAEQQAVREHLKPGCLVLVEGEPGIGKTRLVRETLLHLDVVLLLGRCRELEQTLPYQPIIEALRRLLEGPDGPGWQAWLHQEVLPVWLAEAARLLPELSSTGLPALQRPAEETRLWEGLRQCLLAAARRRPFVLLLDDLNWADASTLGLLGYLARHTAEAPLCLLATARQTSPRSPVAALLQALTRENRLWRLPLDRLNGEDVLEAARALDPTDLPSLAAWLWRTSEGNPYILVEMARHARLHGLHSLAETPTLPQTIYSLVQSRLRGLSEPARRFLDAAVAAGREFDFDVATQAAGLSETAGLDGLDELLASGLVVALPGGRFAFDHPLTMEVAYQEVGEPRHRLQHRKVAETLDEQYRERWDRQVGGGGSNGAGSKAATQLAAQVAWQYTEGGAPQRGARYALLAGNEAARLAAWSEAIAFYEMALKGLPPGERLPVWLSLGDAHAKAGHFPQTYEVLRHARAWLDEHPQPGRVRQSVELSMARSLLPQARFAEAIELAKNISSQDTPESGIAAELIWGTALSIEGADLPGADEHLQAADAAWQAHPVDRLILAQIHFERGSVAAQRGDLAQAVAFYRQSLTEAEQAAQPQSGGLASEYALDQLVLSYNNLAYHLLLSGDPSAVEYAHKGLALAQEKGLLGMQTYLYSTLGEIALAAGSLDSAQAYFTEGLALAERHHISERVAGITANLGLVAARRGDPSVAIHRLSTALGLADALGTHHLGAQVRLWLAPLLPPGEARQRLSEARRIAAEGGRLRLLDEADRIEQQLHS